jgi:nucleoid-associated protein YgaU
MPALEKAYLEAIDGTAQRVEFAFNPKEFSITRTNKLKPEAQKGKDVPKVEFESGSGRQMSFELFFDGYEGKQNVRDAVQKLERLAMVDPSTEGADGVQRPPYVRFGWGREKLFKSFVKSLDVKYTMFTADGTPVRATAKVKLVEVPDEPGGQNPTSVGAPGLRSHMVLPGETLDLIAYRELGSANRWRHIAETNGLDDPWRLAPGQRLVIVPPE